MTLITIPRFWESFEFTESNPFDPERIVDTIWDLTRKHIKRVTLSELDEQQLKSKIEDALTFTTDDIKLESSLVTPPQMLVSPERATTSSAFTVNIKALNVEIVSEAGESIRLQLSGHSSIHIRVNQKELDILEDALNWFINDEDVTADLIDHLKIYKLSITDVKNIFKTLSNQIDAEDLNHSDGVSILRAELDNYL